MHMQDFKYYNCTYNVQSISKWLNTIETKLISDSYAFFDYSVVNLQYYNDNLKIHINILRPLIDTQSLPPEDE